MKQTAFLAIVIVALAFSCKKTQNNVNCYICTSNDSVTSNIPALVNPHYYGYTGTTCNLTEAQEKHYIVTKTYTDTLLLRNDTLEQEHWTMNCDIDY